MQLQLYIASATFSTKPRAFAEIQDLLSYPAAIKWHVVVMKYFSKAIWIGLPVRGWGGENREELGLSNLSHSCSTQALLGKDLCGFPQSVSFASRVVF